MDARISARIGNRSLERRVSVGGGHASGRIGWVHLGRFIDDASGIVLTDSHFDALIHQDSGARHAARYTFSNA